MVRNSELILSLLSLMSYSTLCPPPTPPTDAPSGGSDPSPVPPSTPDAEQVVRDRLRLDLSEREAVRHIDHLVHLSASAVVASVVDRIHKIAQAIRS